MKSKFFSFLVVLFVVVLLFFIMRDNSDISFSEFSLEDNSISSWIMIIAVILIIFVLIKAFVKFIKISLGK
jgi:choline-glycine betaine transporter